MFNHMFWCAASTGDDDGDLKAAKWPSITNHFMNKHWGHQSPLFSQCLHGRLHDTERKKKWLSPGMAMLILNIFYKKCVHNDTYSYYSPFIHFNENSNRDYAKLPDGTQRVNIAFPKHKKGEHTIKNILVQCTYSKYCLNLQGSILYRLI